MPVIAVTVAVVGYLGQADRDDAGAIVSAGSVAADELRVGDCYDDGASSDDEIIEIADVAARPCDEPHDNEVFHTFELTGPNLPSDAALVERVGAECVPAFDAFVGASFETSELDLFPIWPAQGAWDAGDRTVVCSLFRMDRTKLTGSARGTAR